MIQTDNTTLAVAQALITLRDENKALKAEVDVLKAKIEHITNLIKFRRDVVLNCINQGITPSKISEYTALNCIIEDINTEHSFDATDTNVGNNEVKNGK